MEDKFLIIDVNRVTGVAAAVEPDTQVVVIFLQEVVNHLALAFVAETAAQYDIKKIHSISCNTIITATIL